MRLHQGYSGGSAALYLFRRPDGGLHFADVCFLEQEHAETALANAAADRVGEFPGKETAVEIEVGSVETAAFFKLAA